MLCKAPWESTQRRNSHYIRQHNLIITYSGFLTTVGPKQSRVSEGIHRFDALRVESDKPLIKRRRAGKSVLCASQSSCTFDSGSAAVSHLVQMLLCISLHCHFFMRRQTTNIFDVLAFQRKCVSFGPISKLVQALEDDATDHAIVVSFLARRNIVLQNLLHPHLRKDRRLRHATAVKPPPRTL